MENTTASFELVKGFVTAKFPEFGNVVLRECPDADELYRESATEQAEYDKPPRVYAHTLHYPATICVTANMDELSEEQRQGIFIHEFGHLYGVYHPEGDYDPEEEADADLAVLTEFGVNLHYGDDEIEYVVLPIGSEAVDDEEPTEEEIEQALGEIEEEEEEDSYGLGLPTSDDLEDSLEFVPEEEAGEIEGFDSGETIDVEAE